MMYKYKKGFTLIELMIVISIIGILVVVLAPTLTGAPAKARDVGRQKNVNEAKTALSSYFQDSYQFPTAAELSGITDCFSTSSGDVTNKAVAGFFKDGIAPLDVTKGNKTGGCNENQAMGYRVLSSDDGVERQSFAVYQDVETTSSANYTLDDLPTAGTGEKGEIVTEMNDSGHKAKVDALKGDGGTDGEKSIFLLYY